MSQNKWSDRITPFAVGVGLGALLALILAPSSGKDTRDYLTGTLKQGFDGAASTGKRWTRRAQVAVDGVKANVAGALEAGEKAYRSARDA
jgi:gas vesicle protein